LARRETSHADADESPAAISMHDDAETRGTRRNMGHDIVEQRRRRRDEVNAPIAVLATSEHKRGQPRRTRARNRHSRELMAVDE